TPKDGSIPRLTPEKSASGILAGDFDGDGLVDIAGATREGFVFVWPTPGKISNVGRHGYHYKGNVQRTGVWLPEHSRGTR
ncbi:MAG: hypothetical protein EBU49_03640, partial [Proteobacteria bacterium]|nr:hypothetical protein [Pseudomonadota bacterium]